jgi:hypothetical protein
LSGTGETITAWPPEKSVTRPFDASHYEDLRGRVRGVLIAVADAFRPDQLAIVEELIDHNEHVVALEMLVGMLVEATGGPPQRPLVRTST